MYTIYYNGTILSMDPSALYVEAVVTKGSDIIYVGTFEEACKRFKNNKTRMYNLEEKTLMPGFIDGHSHFSMVFQQSAFVDLAGYASYEAIAATLKRYMHKEKTNSKGLVFGFGYDNNLLPGYEHPDKKFLDAISTEIPIVIMHISGHMCVANSKALELAEITLNTPQPTGGVIGRYVGTDELNGYLEENASFLVMKLLKGRVKFSPFKMLKAAQSEYLRHGITTVQDGATDSRTFSLLKILNLLGVFKFDLVSYLLMDEKAILCMRKNYKKYHNSYRRRLKIGGYKLILDGSPQARSAWLTKPYEGETEYCGYPRMSDEEVEKCCKQAIDDNIQLLAHCNGDAASQQYLDCYAAAYNQSVNPYKEDLRPVMIHCQTARKDQLKRMKSLNMIASVFVGHVDYWGDVHLRNLGCKRGNHISPVKTALDCGLSVNFHQDAPITKPDMLHSVWCAVNRITRTGVSLAAEEKIGVMEALRAVTIDAAYAYREEGLKGSVEEGKKADFVILSDNPLRVDHMNIKDIKVLHTIKDGKVVY